jgi:Lon protease-like protein
MENSIPLFPLEVVLFPGLPLPLHIFENRYRVMIKECLEENKEFGVVYCKDNQIYRIGCTAKILRVLKRYDDGRLDILTQGARRFEVKEISEKKIYIQSEVVFFEDQLEQESDELISLAREGVELLKQLDKLTINRSDLEFIEKLDLKVISYIISGIGGFTMNEKQKFLEMTSTSERLKYSVESLKYVIKRVKMESYLKKMDTKEQTFRKFSNN